MKAWTRSPLLSAAITVATLLQLHGASFAQPARAAIGSAVAAPVSDAIRAAHFAEPLVATAPTPAIEDLALVRALVSYERRAKPDDVSSLTVFHGPRPIARFTSQGDLIEIAPQKPAA